MVAGYIVILTLLINTQGKVALNTFSANLESQEACIALIDQYVERTDGPSTLIEGHCVDSQTGKRKFSYYDKR